MTKQLHQRNVTAVTVSINAHSCPTCGVIYGLNDEHEERMNEEGGTWYCTNGHAVVYRDSDLVVMRQRAEIAEARQKRTLADNQRLANDLMDAAKERRRLQRRAKYGVCSECHRSFLNVKRHMASKHS